MKTIIYLIFIIIWAVLQARRKALREAKRKQAEAENTQNFIQQNQPQREVLGPVSAEENRSVATAYNSPMDEPQATVPQPSYLDMMPQELQKFVEGQRPKKKKKRAKEEVVDRQGKRQEKVEEIVTPISTGPDAYEESTLHRPKIRFDSDALRTFIVTREVLGPPRAKRPHRPGITQK